MLAIRLASLALGVAALALGVAALALGVASPALALPLDRPADGELERLRAGVAEVEASLQSIRLALEPPAATAPVVATRVPASRAVVLESGASQPVMAATVCLLLLGAMAGLRARRRGAHAAPAPAARATGEGRLRLRSRGRKAAGMPERRSEPPLTTITTTITPTELKSVLTGTTLTVGDRIGPVAEAELFLSYGRTHQAEQVLREAIEHNPADMESLLCLLEILASGRKADAFNELAALAQRHTDENGPVWKQIASLGRTADPGNPRYQDERTATSPQVWVSFLPGQGTVADAVRQRAVGQR